MDSMAISIVVSGSKINSTFIGMKQWMFLIHAWLYMLWFIDGNRQGSQVFTAADMDKDGDHRCFDQLLLICYGLLMVRK